MDAAIIKARSVTQAPAEVGVLLARYVSMEEGQCCDAALNDYRT